MFSSNGEESEKNFGQIECEGYDFLTQTAAQESIISADSPQNHRIQHTENDPDFSPDSPEANNQGSVKRFQDSLGVQDSEFTQNLNELYVRRVQNTIEKIKELQNNENKI